MSLLLTAPNLSAASLSDLQALDSDLAALESRKKTHPIEFFEPHAKQAVVDNSLARIIAVIGANRSGKTVYGAVRTVKHARANAGARVWCVAVDFPASRDVQQVEVFNWLPPSEIVDFNKQDLIAKLRNGSEIGFKSAAAGRESFQGTSRDLIWFDEEPPEDVYRECYARTMDCAGRILFTLTPIKGSLWLWDEFTAAGVDVHYMGLIDNPHVPATEIEAAKRLYHGEEYQVRIEGKYILMAGGWPRFNRERLMALRSADAGGGRTGDLSHGAYMDAQNGPMALLEAPIANETYIVAADTAEGIPGGDYDCCKVLRRSTGRIVASWRERIPRHVFAGVVLDLARWFNSAWLAPEVNTGAEIVQAALDAHYPRIYTQVRYDRQEQAETSRLGWKTDGRSRPMMLSTLEQRINDGSALLDPGTIDECLQFIRTDKMPDGEAGPKSHDDQVIAAAIAYQVDRELPRSGGQTDIKPGFQAYTWDNDTTGY